MSSQPPPFENVRKMLSAQWCGCGAQPGKGLLPMRLCDSGCQPQAMVIPGYAAGPHGFDTLTADSIPNVCASYPLIYNVPEVHIGFDPIDSRLWNPPTTRYGGTTESYLPWLYGGMF